MKSSVKKAAARAVASGSKAVGKAVKRRLASKEAKEEFIEKMRGK